MLTLAERFRDLLVPILAVSTAVLVALLAILVAQRAIRALRQASREALARHYRPLVHRALASPEPLAPELAALLPRRYRDVIGALVLRPLRAVRGQENVRAREIANHLGLLDRWRQQLHSRRWWQATPAAVALGLVRDEASVPSLVALLDHDHPEVRSAAIDALGFVGAVEAIPALVARMNDPGRHERARVVEALHAYGDQASEALVQYARSQPAARAAVAGILMHVGGAAAADALLEWTTDADAAVRAAAWRALATVGLSDRAFYHALKALGDDAQAVRAAAARALGRSGRGDAAPYLAGHLDDEWDVAAQAARAMGRLGAAGTAALQRRADGDPGLGQDLAKQLLWEHEGAR